MCAYEEVPDPFFQYLVAARRGCWLRDNHHVVPRPDVHLPHGFPQTALGAVANHCLAHALANGKTKATYAETIGEDTKTE